MYSTTYGSTPVINAMVSYGDVYNNQIPNGVVYYKDQACTQKVSDITKADVGTYYVRGEFPGNDVAKPSVSEVKTFTVGFGYLSFAFTTKSVTKHTTDIGTKFTNDTLTPTPTTTVTYSTYFGDTNVASVDASTGEVTINGVGQTMIKATVASSTNYLAVGTPYYTINVTDHTYSKDVTYTWSADNTKVTATGKCEECDAEGSETVDTTTTTTDATCKDPKTTTYTATFTKAGFTTQTKDVTEGVALGHSAEHHEAKDATCTEDGNIEYWVCSRCNKYFSDEACTQETTAAAVKVAATGHSYGEPRYSWVYYGDLHPTKPNTAECIATRTCTKCQNKETEEGKITSEVTQQADCTNPEFTTFTATFTNSAFTTQKYEGVYTKNPLGHDYVHHDLVPATTSKSGMKEYYSCSRCGKVFDADKNETTLDALTIEQLKQTPSAEASVENTALDGVSEEVQKKVKEESTKAVQKVAEKIVKKELKVDGITIPENNDSISSVKVVLNVKSISADATTKAQVESFVNGTGEIKSYAEATLTSYVINASGVTESEKNVTNTGGSNVPVTLSLVGIDDLDNVFIKVVHIHEENGKTTLEYLPATVDKVNKTVTVYMSEFSKLAIVVSKTTDVSYISDSKTYTTQTVTYNGKLSKPIDPTKSGYTFNGWYTNDSYTTAYDFNTGVTEDSMKLYAKWTKNASTTLTKTTTTSSSTTNTGYKLVQTDAQ